MKTLPQPLMALSILLLCSMQVFSQGGNVGIGTLSPLHPLHVETAASMSESRAIFGLATAGSGSTYGVHGLSNSTSGRGVFGEATASSGPTYGVRGESSSTDGRGVFGWAGAVSGTTYGVRGESLSTSGRGVFGWAGAVSGTTYGVRGESLSTSGHGVFGDATASSGFTYGVRGRNSSTSGIGVYGQATAGSGGTFGVYGLSNSTSGRGVLGEATAGSGTTYGVRGESLSTTGRGVYGLVIASSGSTYGVWGQSFSTSGRGVYGLTIAGSGTTYGIYGLSFSTSGHGVYGEANAISGTTYGVYGDVSSPDGYAGYFTGHIQSRNYFQRNVGIGTETPNEMLEVAGNIHVSGSNRTIFNRTNSSLAFGTNNTERMLITGGGAIGIGTAAPDVKFEIQGSAPIGARMTSTTSGDVTLDFKRSGNGWRVRNTGGELWFAQTNSAFSTFTEVFRIGGSSVTPATDNVVVLGQSSRRWTAVWAVNGTIQTSDQSLKKNIAPLSSGINTVRQMQPVMFSWRDGRADNHRSHYGFLAQDLLEVLPDVVVTHEWREIPDTPDREWVPVEHLGVTYSEIIPVLVKAIQEQQELLEAREVEIEQLKDMLHIQQEQIGNILSVLKISGNQQNRHAPEVKTTSVQ